MTIFNFWNRKKKDDLYKRAEVLYPNVSSIMANRAPVNDEDSLCPGRLWFNGKEEVWVSLGNKKWHLITGIDVPSFRTEVATYEYVRPNLIKRFIENSEMEQR